MLYLVIRYGVMVYISLQCTSESEMAHGMIILLLLTAQLSLPRRLQELFIDIPKREPADRAVHLLRRLFDLALPRLARRFLLSTTVCSPTYF